MIGRAAAEHNLLVTVDESSHEQQDNRFCSRDHSGASHRKTLACQQAIQWWLYDVCIHAPADCMLWTACSAEVFLPSQQVRCHWDLSCPPMATCCIITAFLEGKYQIHAAPGPADSNALFAMQDLHDQGTAAAASYSTYQHRSQGCCQHVSPCRTCSCLQCSGRLHS